MKDVSEHIGTTREVTVNTGLGLRTVSVTVGDAGPFPFWDHRPAITLTCEFRDGKRANADTAASAAGELAGQLFHPYGTVALGDEAWGLKTDREYRSTGPKYGRTKFTFTVCCGPYDVSVKYERMREAGRTDVLAVIEADFKQLRELKAGGLSDDAARRRVAPQPNPAVDAALARMAARHAAKAS